MHGLTQVDLAKKISVANSVIWQLENNPSMFPCSSTVAKVAKFFEINPGDLFDLNQISI